MNIAKVSLEPDGAVMDGPRNPEPTMVLIPAQRKALVQLCRLHEQGYDPRRLGRRSLLLSLYIAFTLAFSVLLLNMTAFAPPAYIFLGFVLSALLNNLRLLGGSRAIWPVYEAIIDWPRAFHLLKKVDESVGGGEVDGIA